MNPTTTDVVIIGLNEELLLEACIKSVKQFADIGKVIYVDSGSNDSSVSIASKSVDTIICAINRPAFAAESRNIGLQAVESKYVLFLDGDMQLKNCTSTLIEHLQQNDVGVFGIRNDLHIDGRRNVIKTINNVYNTHTKKIASHVGGAAIYNAHALKANGGFVSELQCFEEPRLLIEFASKDLNILEVPSPFIDHYIKPQIGRGGSIAKKTKRCYEFGYLVGNCLQHKRVYQLFQMFPIVPLLYLVLFVSLTTLFAGYIPALITFIVLFLSILLIFQKKQVALNVLYCIFLPFSLFEYLILRKKCK